MSNFSYGEEMFGARNLAMSALPCGYVYHTCAYYYSYCGYNYYSFCGQNYITYHCAYAYITSLHPQQAVQCPGATAIPAAVGPGDPVEALHALRQQLEVALARVRAQEAELQRQRAAARGGGGGD